MPYDDQGAIIAKMYDGDYAAARTPCGDVDFYVEEARRSGGPVLELACGSGRILVPTARAGIEIVGLDSSRAMLDFARRNLGDLEAELVEGDMRDHDLRRQFALVTIPFRGIAHIEETDGHVAVFRNARRHLAPGGRLVFDFYQPQPGFMLENWQGEKLQLEREEGGRKIRRYHSVTGHLARQCSDITFRWEVEDPSGHVETFSSSFVMRWFHRFELEHLLARTGFEIEALYGDFRRGPLTDDSKDMVFVAKPAA